MEPRRIALSEHVPLELPQDGLSRTEADAIWAAAEKKVSVESPGPATKGRWRLTSEGWVGFIPVSPELLLELRPKVPIGNLFRMLEYAYRLQSLEFGQGVVGADPLKDLYSRLAEILARRVLDRVRKGLHASYVQDEEALLCVRGSIDLDARLRRPWQARLDCRYEEHTRDLEENQILGWTLHRILRTGICAEQTSAVVRKAFHALGPSVTLQPVSAAACVNRVYSRLNADYEALHALCRFFLDGTGPSHRAGDHNMLPFAISMPRLFEMFLAEWLRAHLPSHLDVLRKEPLRPTAGEAEAMEMDILLVERPSGTGVCVLDAKYKGEGKADAGDVQQAVTYAETVGCHSALLVYPEPRPPLDVTYGRNRIRNAWIDLQGDLTAGGQGLLSKIAAIIPAPTLKPVPARATV